MGRVLRRFWLPALLSSELDGPDSGGVRVSLLGEQFVAFRDSEGRLGILDELCPHRGASLMLARCEAGGLRCIYHGWKFATDGRVLEAPNVRSPAVAEGAAPAVFPVRARSYPVREVQGLVWVYLGPPELEPAFPYYPFMDADPSYCVPKSLSVDCNWVQALEGGLDSSHVDVLHRNHSPFRARAADADNSAFRSDDDFADVDEVPSVEVEPSEVGFHAAFIRRSPAEAKSYVRVHAFVMPVMSMVPPAGNTFYVPVNDHQTKFLSVTYNPSRRLDPDLVWSLVHGGDAGAFQDGHFQGDADNRWRQDRTILDSSFTGIAGLLMEDMAVCVSMGPVYDRSREHLVPTDRAVVAMRRMLLEAADAVERGEAPKGLVPAAKGAVRAVDGVVGEGETWTRLLRAG